jgi:hypothetical protein
VPKISPVFIAESVNLDISRGKDGKFALEGGWTTYAGTGLFDAPKGGLKLTGETPFGRGCVTRNASSSPPSGRHRYASREALLGPVNEAHDRSSKRLLILTLVLFQEA